MDVHGTVTLNDGERYRARLTSRYKGNVIEVYIYKKQKYMYIDNSKWEEDNEDNNFGIRSTTED